ncbi:MAG: hypothetical protein KatS3mg067_0741 [Thermosynechococcus sp.]|uniref:hypothetical protein n=1 Tax=Thermosynechococcus sp. TaxID=2814275 RepID=UPI00220B6397|nr:hypothetical protein [Thermosynechococcus sp.]BCX11803.1 MAG: hypothetical protein KatS3mg067_0741 [Thermosynechococcus sp.]
MGQAPYVANADGSYTLWFVGYGVTGGVTEAVPSAEIAATVTRGGHTTIGYNGLVCN